jgi:cytochrome c-type biogenesis protein CcmH/NrfG
MQQRSDAADDPGWFYYRVKDYRTAVEQWEHAVEEQPSAEIFARLGHARLRLGEREGAMEAWMRALDLDAERPDIYKALGLIAMEQDLVEQAEDFLTEACRLEPDDPESQELLARVFCARGAYAQAGVCYEQLLRLDPNRHQMLVPQIVALYKRQVDLAVTTQ